jgi:hypothetical protein
MLGVTNGGHALTPNCVALVPNVEQGDGDVTENQHVALTELCEGLVGSPLQSVVEVIASSRGKPSRHSHVSEVSRNVHMDLEAPQPKLMVRMATVCGNPHVAKAVQHVLEQGGKTGAVQPITMEPSVGSEGGIGVVVHLSKLGRNKSIFHPSNRDNKPKLQINHDDNKTLTQMLFRLTMISENSVRAWWAALSRVLLRSSPQAVVNQAIIVMSVR